MTVTMMMLVVSVPPSLVVVVVVAVVVAPAELPLVLFVVVAFVAAFVVVFGVFLQILSSAVDPLHQLRKGLQPPQGPEDRGRLDPREGCVDDKLVALVGGDGQRLVGGGDRDLEPLDQWRRVLGFRFRFLFLVLVLVAPRVGGRPKEDAVVALKGTLQQVRVRARGREGEARAVELQGRAGRGLKEVEG